jgi:hypothetical protein
MKLLLPTLLALLLLNNVWGQSTSQTSVFFDLDKADLSADATAVLRSLAQELATAPDYDIRINAYTDDQGSVAYNDQLAQERGQSVAQLLAQQGIVTEKTTVRGWGEQKQQYSNKTEDGRRQNRRVDLVVTTWLINDAATFAQRMASNAPQTFVIDNAQEQRITGRNGTLVIVPPDAFEDENGNPVTGPVDVVITEALTPADWIIHGLSTTSDGRLLQSGGMAKIEAFANGKPVNLAETAKLTVGLPFNNGFDNGMRLFYGSHDEPTDPTAPAATPTINWTLASNNAEFRETIEDQQAFYRVIDQPLSNLMQKCSMVPFKRVEPPRYKPLPEPTAPNKPSYLRARATPPPNRTKIEKIYADNQGRLSTKQKAQADEVYRQRYQIYARDSIMCARNLLFNTQNEENYKKQCKQYESDFHTWDRMISSRVDTLKLYRLNLYGFHVWYAYSDICKKVLIRNKEQRFTVLFPYIEERVKRAADARFDQDEYSRMVLKEIMSHTAMVKNAEYYGKKGGSSWSWDYSNKHLTSGRFGLRRNGICSSLISKTSLRALSDSLYALDVEKIAPITMTYEQRARVGMYIAEVVSLGWINCDKFYNNPEPLVKSEYKVAGAFTMYVYFPRLRSMMGVQGMNDKFVLSNVPKGETVHLVMLKTVEGKLQMARTNTVIGTTAQPDFVFKPYTIREIRQELASL